MSTDNKDSGFVYGDDFVLTPQGVVAIIEVVGEAKLMVKGGPSAAALAYWAEDYWNRLLPEQPATKYEVREYTNLPRRRVDITLRVKGLNEPVLISLVGEHR